MKKTTELLTSSINDIRSNILNSLKRDWFLENYWGENEIKIVEIRKWLYSVEWKKKNITYYSDSNWDVILNIKFLAKNYYFQKANILAWYTEKKREDKIFEMYRIKWIEKNWEKVGAKLWEKLDKYSLEYYQAWKNINFFEDILWIKSLLISTEWGLSDLDIEALEIISRSWALRIKDLEQFKKQRQITDEIFKQTIALFQTKEDNLLLQQIWDERFERVNEWVTQKEIKDYYNKGYITEDLYNLALEKIKELESLETRKQTEIQKQIWEEKKAIRNL